MQNTTIQWANHTLNFWWGCTKVSRACKHCYAESVAKVFGKRLFGQVPQWGAGKPRFERLAAARKEALKIQRQAVKSGTRPRVFVNSMSDWLDDEVPIEWLGFLLETLTMCPDVDFQLLTKRPENWLRRFTHFGLHWDLSRDGPGKDTANAHSRWLSGNAPPNLWIGTTVEDQAAAEARIPHLLNIPAKVRFLSCEPLMGPVRIFQPDFEHHSNIGLHWVIAGGESGGPAEPTHPDWFRSLRDQCAAAGVPFFFKQFGEWLPVDQMRHVKAEASLARAYKGHTFPDGTLMLRVGVDTAGALLDGAAHLSFPQ
jgi:protein gp37